MSGPVAKVHVNIDRLILNGVEPAERAAVLAGFEAQLRQSLSAPGAGQALAAGVSAPRAPQSGGRASDDVGVGRAAAQALAKGLTS